MPTATPSQSARTLRLLWYNTYLLHGITLTPELLYTLLGEPLVRAPNSGRAALARAALRAIERAGRHRLLRQLDVRPLRVGRKPDVTPRARELGERLGQLAAPAACDAFVAALGEVFSEQVLTELLERAHAPGLHVSRGPGAGLLDVRGSVPEWLVRMSEATGGQVPVSSGLATLSRGVEVLREAGEAFWLTSSTPDLPPWTWLGRGHPLRDPDFWANKGVLLTEFEIAGGGIELYSTHLFSGQVVGAGAWQALRRTLERRPGLDRLVDGLWRTRLSAPFRRRLGMHRHFFELPDDLRLLIQRAQLRQVVDFVRRHHRRDNLVVLAGDFNLDGRDPRQARLLRDELARLEAFGIELRDPFATRELVANGSRRGTVIEPAHLFGIVEADEATVLGSAGAPDERADTERIDYVFVQRPTPVHPFDVEILGCARHAFAREGDASGSLRFLSDHLALELTLRVQPRPAQTREARSGR